MKRWRPRGQRWLRWLQWAWASPCTVPGLLIGLVLRAAGGGMARVGPAWEFSLPPALAQHRLLRRWPFAALTLGHVVLGNSAADLARLRRHEQAHVRQYARWGPLFLLAYPLASLLAACQGGCPYRDNRFEREARAAEGRGAAAQPPRR